MKRKEIQRIYLVDSTMVIQKIQKERKAIWKDVKLTKEQQEEIDKVVEEFKDIYER